MQDKVAYSWAPNCWRIDYLVLLEAELEGPKNMWRISSFILSGTVGARCY